MRRYRGVALHLTLVLLLGMSPMAAWGQSLAEKAKLQAAMQTHVDRLTVDGIFPYFDKATGEVRALHAVTAHPTILTGDGYYVLCFDFRNDAGEPVNVDFFMAPKDGEYVVFHTIVDNDRTLTQVVGAGSIIGPR